MNKVGFYCVSLMPLQVIVMFRSRFHEAFPRSVPHFGPQDIERGVSDALPDEQVERLLCALLGLVLNRKKDIECDRPCNSWDFNSPLYLGEVIILEHWKKPYLRSLHSGQRHGMVLTRSTKGGVSTA
jgi:hypothetical protein